jgi:TP901 family phage tail tape measure protein
VAFADTQQLVVQLDLKGNLKAKLGDAARAIQGFDKATSNTQQSLSKFGRNIERGVVIGIAATGTALLGVVKAAADYESAFAGVRKTVTATEPQLQELSNQFRALSKEIPISASELARLGEAGGALGVPTAQLKEFVRVTALLGVTTNLSADEAANSLGILGNVLHLTGEDYQKFASSLVALGNAGASTESDIIAISERIGATGHLIGISTQDILGFSSAVASLGIETEAGGTALQKFFIDSAKMVAGGGKDLKEFAKVAGVSTAAFKKSFDKDASGALQSFLAGLGKLPQAKQLKVLEDLGFNDARITRTLLGLANNTQLVSDQMGVANKAFGENTALTKEAEQRFNTFDSQLTITKNVLQDMAITIGSKLLPKITPLLKRLNEFVGANQGKIEEFGTKLADGFERFANAIQKVDWQPFIDGLRISSDIAKTAIKLFMSLPDGVKAAAIGAFAVNKITGGLPVSIAKDVGGAVLDRFASRGSSAANPLWVQQVGGAAGAATGGAKGALGRIASVASKVFLVGAAVGVFAELAGILDDQSRANKEQEAGLAAQTKEFTGGATLAELKQSLAGVDAQIADLNNGLTPEKIAFQINKDGVRDAIEKSRADLVAAIHEQGGSVGLFSKLGGTIGTALATLIKPAQTGGLSPEERDANSKQLREAEAATLAVRRVEAAENRTGTLITSSGAALGKHLSALQSAFRTDLSGLRKATKPLDIAKFAKSIAADVQRGAGSAAGTKGVLKDLKIKLAQTDDPKTRAVLQAAIRGVQAKLPNREWVQGQLTAAKKIAGSSATEAKKTSDLIAIQKTLRTRGDTHAAKIVGGLIKVAAKVDTGAKASRATTEAIKDKDLSVKLNVPVTVNTNVRVSARETSKTQTTFRKIGKVFIS